MIRNTKKSSNLHVTVILLLMLSFIFSCTTTDDFVDMHEHVNEHSHYHPYRVDFKTFSRATSIPSLKKYFDEHSLFAKNATTDTLDYDDFVADQNSILQYPLKNGEFKYSFRLTPKFASSSDEVYNLVIKRDSVSNEWHGTGYRLKKSVNGLTKYESIKELFTTNFSSITLQKGHWQGEWTEYTESHCTNTGSCASTGTCDQCSLCVTTTVGYTLTYIDLGDSTTGGGTPAHGDGSSPIQGGNGGTGTGGSDDDFAINDGIIDAGDDPNNGSVQVGEDEKEKDCAAIKAPLNSVDPNSPERRFLNEIKLLAAQASMLQNEASVGLHKNHNNLTNHSGTANNAQTQMLENPPAKYVAYFHLHNNAPGGTYSVFSFDDLKGFAYQLRDDNIDSGEFVAYLSTHHGTHYALRIKNVRDFKKFFSVVFPEPVPSANSTTFEINTYQQRKKILATKYIDTRDKYYKGATPIINQIETDALLQQRQFLEFLNEADMGVDLYQTDANFSSFDKLELKNNQLKRISC